MTLDHVIELTGRLDEESELAASHYENALDASRQLEGRASHARQALEALEVDNVPHAKAHLAAMLDHCPTASNVQTWLVQSRKMLHQAALVRAELHEAVAKLRDVEEARVKHGGTA